MASIQGFSEGDTLQEKVARIRAERPGRKPGTLRILFVNPPSPDGYVYIRDTNRSGRRSKENTIWPQTSLAMLASVFPKETVKIVDCIAEGINYSDLFDIMQDFGPDYVVFNPISSTITHDMIVAHYAHSIKAKTIAVSPHTKVYKEECHDRFPSLDYSVDFRKGGPEPEYVIREIITGISADGTKFEDIPPARQDLLPISRYNLPFIGRGYTFVITSRGCPWACIYCRAAVQNERVARFRPVDTVIREIKDYNLKNIAFHADTATMNKEWIYEFCKKVIDLKLGIRWICNSRVDTVNFEMLKLMKQAGCWMVVYGCESGNNRVLAMNKKEATVEQAKNAITWAKRAGLRVWGYFMLGMYGDNSDSMDDTIRFACSMPFDIVNFAISAPYPGTEWNKIATGEGWLVDDRWESYDQNYSAQVDQPGCSPELVKRYQRRAYFRWYFSLRGLRFLVRGFRLEYIMYFIRTIRNHLKL